MFYRRKILLALVASFGGSLSERNCHLLLYLFCLRRNKNFYDFFPYKESYVSLILHQDKNRLINLGFLAPEQDFQINREQLSSFQLLEDATYQKLFDYYSAHILPAHLDAIQQLKTILLNEHRTVLTCFEANPTSKYEEQVCTAGFLHDGTWIRLYPSYYF